MHDRLTSLLAPIVEGTGLEVWSLELTREGGRQVLRVLIDSPNGVTDEDCRTVSAAVSAALDAVDPIPGAYTLEVSSPGVDRRLRNAGDYTRFAGRTALLHLHQPIQGRDAVEGTLLGLEGDQVLVQVRRDSLAIPFSSIREGRLTLGGFGKSVGEARERRRDGQPITAAQ